MSDDFQHTHYVYRCYDAEDRLLYIGCTQDMGSRMAVHYASGANPASRVLIYRMVRHEVETFQDKASAQAAERAAIYAEAPLANLHHQRIKEKADERNRRIDRYIEATRPEPDPEWAETSALLKATLAGSHTKAAS